MKTLDEVIKALRCTDPEVDPETKCNDCPYKESRRNDLWYVGPSCLDEMFSDALCYLKEYREKHDDILRMEEALGYCEIMDSPPLDWEQLKQMEGKPVWVEYESCNRKVWAIIDCFYTDAFLKVIMNVALPHDYWNLEKEMMGKTWQAYRKERG